MNNLIWVALGGALGSSLRYLSTNLIKYLYPNFPFGTLFVNIFGSFLIGFLMNYLEEKNISESFIKYFIIIGLLGSYTTFSAFSFEVIDMINNHRIFISIIYVLISVISCLIFAYLGYNLHKA